MRKFANAERPSVYVGLIAMLLILLAGGVYAGKGTQTHTVLFDCLGDASYTLDTDTALIQSSHYEGKIDLRFDSDGYPITDLQVCISYDPDQLWTPEIDTNSTEYFDWSSASVFQVIPDSTCEDGTFFLVHAVFPETVFVDQPLFAIELETYCIEDSDRAYLSLEPSNCGEGMTNIVHSDQTIYSVCTKNDGWLYIPEAHGDVYPADTTLTYIGASDVMVPIYVETDFPSTDYFVIIVWDTTYANYDSTSFAGCWTTMGGTYRSNDTLYIYSSTAPGATSETTMCKMYYHMDSYNDDNTITWNTSSPISVAHWIIGIKHGDFCSGDSGNSPDTGWIQIPYYDATFQAPDLVVGRNLTGIKVPISLQTCFPVETDIDPDSDKVYLRYSIDTTGLTCYSIYGGEDNTILDFGRLHWSLTDHLWQDSIPNGIMREVNRIYANAMIPPLAPATAIDTVLATSIDSLECEDPIAFRADPVNFVGGMYHRDFFLKPKYYPDTVFAKYPIGADLDTLSDIVLVNGSFRTHYNAGCPYLYAWDGQRFSEENTILNQADHAALAKPRADFYRLSTNLKPSDGKYRLQIREFEAEESHFDAFDLRVVEHPDGSMLNVSKKGDISVYRGEISPASAIDDFGVDHVSEIKTEDGVFFTSETPGSIVLTYNVGKGFDWDGAALGSTPPYHDIKKYSKLVAGGSYRGPSPVVTEVMDLEGNWISLDKVANRGEEGTGLPTFAPRDFVRNGQVVLRQSWETRIFVDKISFYLPSNEPYTEVSTHLVSAKHSSKGDVYYDVVNADDDAITLIPGQTIDLEFSDLGNPPIPPGYVRDFVFESKGYYTSYDGPINLPESYSLMQNYPNPFNPSTTIYYTLPAATDVQLTVYNSIGQRVKTLINRHQIAGRQSVVWDGRDEHGNEVASGVYLYKLVTTDYSASRKMMLIK